MLVRVQRNEISHSLLVEMQNGIATLKQSMDASYKTRRVLIIQPRDCILRAFMPEK